eukprot:4119605-Prymnesium_polylepis.2
MRRADNCDSRGKSLWTLARLRSCSSRVVGTSETGAPRALADIVCECRDRFWQTLAGRARHRGAPWEQAAPHEAAAALPLPSCLPLSSERP